MPALWCIPEGSDPDRVLLHSHSGGTVVTSMHTDRKGIGHIAKVVGVRALVPNYRRSPEHKFPAQIDDVEKAYRWLLAQRIQPENIASIGRSSTPIAQTSSEVLMQDKEVPTSTASAAADGLAELGVAAAAAAIRNGDISSESYTSALLSAPKCAPI